MLVRGNRFHPYKCILPVQRGYIPRQKNRLKNTTDLQQSANRRTGTSSTIVQTPTATAPPARFLQVAETRF
ncbi:hypothetical protein E4T56_gene20238 [Termitomyces sp. T112]|nr:hypothetical protein E4T56_gene20238 [Termitomyces sp. T112]